MLPRCARNAVAGSLNDRLQRQALAARMM